MAASLSGYYDRAGRPIDLWEWARLSEDWDYKVIEKTPLVTGTNEGDAECIEVSTVWMGLDHNFDITGPILIFETMIFGGEYNEYQWRYTTEDQAREGHEKVVAWLKTNPRGTAGKGLGDVL